MLYAQPSTSPKTMRRFWTLGGSVVYRCFSRSLFLLARRDAYVCAFVTLPKRLGFCIINLGPNVIRVIILLRHSSSSLPINHRKSTTVMSQKSLLWHLLWVFHSLIHSSCIMISIYLFVHPVTASDSICKYRPSLPFTAHLKWFTQTYNLIEATYSDGEFIHSACQFDSRPML